MGFTLVISTTPSSRRVGADARMTRVVCIGAAVVASALGCSPDRAGDGTTTPHATPAGAPAAGGSAAAPGDSGRSARSGRATFAGVAFVDATVTGQGSLAKLPPQTKIYWMGSKVTGTQGCPTTRYRTDGLPVAVIDYDGRPTSASLTIVHHADGATRRERAPYHLDLNPGRTVQMLGPMFDNGRYELELTYDFRKGDGKKVRGEFTLARSCP